MLLAAWAVVDPDYPLPRAVPTASSTETGTRLVPTRLQVADATGANGLSFSWQLPPGASAVEFVLLDAGRDEVLRVPVAGDQFVANDPVRALLQNPGQMHWRIECDCAGIRCASATALAGISVETNPVVTAPTVPEVGVTQLGK